MKKKFKRLLLGFILLIISLFTLSFDLRASIDENDCNVIIKVFNYTNSYTLCKIVSVKNNSQWLLFDDNDTYRYDGLITNGVYYAVADYDIDTYYINIYEYWTINDYNNYKFQDGYNMGAQADNDSVYNQGYNTGYNFAYSQQYGEAYNQGYAEGIADNQQNIYNQGYADGEQVAAATQFNLLSLLGTIFMFPFKLVALGFDVEIFGVNVGALLIAIMVIGVVLGIVGIALGVRRKL